MTNDDLILANNDDSNSGWPTMNTKGITQITIMGVQW